MTSFRVLIVLTWLTKVAETLNVFGYAPEWQQSTLEYRELFRSGLTHLILFSVEIDPASGSLTAVDRGVPHEGALVKIRREAAEEGVKIMVCVGGGGRSAGFPKLARDKVKRIKFLNELNSILIGRKLAGVDFNWERPMDDVQWRDFGKLLRDAKKILLSGKAVVTFSYHPDGVSEQSIQEAPEVIRYADFALAMAYDDQRGHSDFNVAQSAKSNWVKNSLDPKKLVIGTAFYARNVHTFEAKGYDEVYKDRSQLWLKPSKNELRQKLDLVKGCCGGIMIWALGHDLHPHHSQALMSVFRDQKDEL